MTSAEAGPGERGVRRQALEAVAWLFTTHGASNVLRLATHLVLARLLLPEVFGLVAIVQAFLDGLQMLSDLGVGLSVVQSKRGEEDRYLDTAWTIQAARGVALWAIAIMLAWPLARFYEEPALGPLIALAAFSLLLNGFTSMSLFRLQRALAIGKLTRIELGAQIVSAVAMTAWVAIWPSVWGLVFGRLVAAMVKLVWSHAIAEAPRHRLRIERGMARDFYQFGRWVVFTTPFSFILNQGDRLILGRFVSMEALGLFAIAAILVKSIQQLNTTVSSQVLFPLYAQIGREVTDQFYAQVRKVRLALLAAFLPPLWLLVVFGRHIVDLLYDDRYLGAGWIVQVLAAGATFTVIGRGGPIHLARGKTRDGFVLAAGAALVFALAAVIGYQLAGSPGMIVGIAVGSASQYPFEVWVARRHRIWVPSFDAVAIAATLGVIALAWYWRAPVG